MGNWEEGVCSRRRAFSLLNFKFEPHDHISCTINYSFKKLITYNPLGIKGLVVSYKTKHTDTP